MEYSGNDKPKIDMIIKLNNNILFIFKLNGNNDVLFLNLQNLFIKKLLSFIISNIIKVIIDNIM